MRVVAAVVAIGIITTLGLWAALALLALTYAVHVFALKLEIREVCGVLTNVTACLTEAQEQLQGAQERVEMLEHARGTVSGSHHHQSHSELQALYRRVGLSETCPEFVLDAAHRAYRKALHPDLQPPRQKLAAERRFKEAEATFADIRRHRKR
jgi:hypothetical protein